MSKGSCNRRKGYIQGVLSQKKGLCPRGLVTEERVISKGSCNRRKGYVQGVF